MQFTRDPHNNFTANLNLDGNETSIYWHGIGGRTIDKFRKFDLDNIFDFKPDIVYLQLGGNDLSNAPNGEPSKVFKNLEILFKQLKKGGVKKVIVGHVFQRKKADIDIEFYNRTVVAFNYLCDELLPLQGSILWKIKGLWSPENYGP